RRQTLDDRRIPVHSHVIDDTAVRAARGGGRNTLITTVREERMLVVSDVHLGNPLYAARRPFVDFLRFALDREYPVCINGDGVDIIQSSVPRLARDLTGCNREFS